MDLLQSDSVIFTDTTHISAKELFKKAFKVSSFLKKQSIAQNTCYLIDLDDPLSIIIALFAIWHLGGIAALLNPKMITSLKNTLLDDLGPYVSVTSLKEDDDPFDMTLDIERISLLVATSGSIGKPKWIASSLKNWILNAQGTNAHLNAKSCEPWVLNLPLFHVSGLSILFRALLSNAPLVITKRIDIPNARFSFIPKQIDTFIEKNQLPLLLKASSILIGGGKINVSTFKQLQGFPFYLTFGMTECCSSITVSDKNPPMINEGKSLLHRELILTQSGSIFIRGNAVCDFKWVKSSLQSLKNEDGFYETGDYGQLIDGNLNILGRHDERIEINGEKIHAYEVQKALQSYFPFKQLIITHIKNENKEPIVCAFCYPLPSSLELKGLKSSTGSLFFPKYFFELTEQIENQKILLKDLKEKALAFICDKESQNAQ